MQTRTRRWLAAGLIAVSVSLLGAPFAAAETKEHVLAFEGMDRTYLLAMADALDPGPEGVPLVIMLHGAGTSGAIAARMTGLDVLAEEEGFIAVFPDGSSPVNRLYTWNVGHCCGYAATEGINDIGFVTALMDHLLAAYPVDPDRVYLVGMSNGGMLAQRFAAMFPERIAAVGSVVGGLFGDEAPPVGPVPAILINGGRDHVIPAAGGAIGSGLNPFDEPVLMPSQYQALYWAEAAGCGADTVPLQRATGAFASERYECTPGVAVEFYLVHENGHAWPGDTSRLSVAEVPSTDFDATAAIWTFFAAHRLSDRPPPQQGIAVEPLPPVGPDPGKPAWRLPATAEPPTGGAP